MLSPDLLKLLVCPETQQALSMADEDIISELNGRLLEGKVLNLSGVRLERPLEGGLIREDRKILYPILDGIPALLSDEAIELGANDE